VSPFGPGRYDDLCTYVRKKSAATSVILIITGGKFGHGISMHAPAEEMLKLPKVLRTVAADIERKLRQGQIP